MDRLTHERVNGIKRGYWSPAKKDDLVAALAAYENTGITPEGVKELMDKIIKLTELAMRDWIPVEEKLPETEDYILLSFANFSYPLIGWYAAHEDGSGAFYLGDCDGVDTCAANDLFVNAWMPLPEAYRKDEI